MIAEGALTGAIAGVLFGPAGLAVGLVGGATAGSVGEARHAPHLHDALIDPFVPPAEQGQVGLPGELADEGLVETPSGG